MNSNEIAMKNQNIDDVNSKLRSDLEKCQLHLQSVVKNN